MENSAADDLHFLLSAPYAIPHFKMHNTPSKKKKKKAFPIIHVDIVPFPGLPYQLTCSALNDRYFNNNNFNPLNRPHISTSSSNIYNCVSLSTKLWSLQRQSYYFLFLSISPGHLTNAVNREPCTIKSDEEMNEWVSWGKCHSESGAIEKQGWWPQSSSHPF